MTDLLDIAREEILKNFRLDSCVAATRIAVEVLRAYGHEAVALPVRVMVFNAPCAKHVENGEWSNATRKDSLRWFEEDGSWSVGIGSRRVRTGDREAQVGHLVALWRKARLLVDLSLDQASRPDKGIHLKPTAVPLLPGFLQGTTPVGYRDGDGTVVLWYKASNRENGAYLKMPDWLDSGRWMPVVVRILQRYGEVQ